MIWMLRLVDMGKKDDEMQRRSLIISQPLLEGAER